MTDFRFYHLQKSSFEDALPAILSKALERGLRAVVMLGSRERAEALSARLWEGDPNSFLPHGTEKDGHAADQPVWITPKDENPNGAKLLVLADGAVSTHAGDYDIVCDMFDGWDGAAVEAARARFKAARDGGHEVTYWKQTDRGAWEK